MFNDSDTEIVVNLDYKLVKKEHEFMITKTLFIRCYFIKCDLCLNSVQNNIMHYIIALTNNSLFESNFQGTNKHHCEFFI